jgi:zinc protease
MPITSGACQPTPPRPRAALPSIRRSRPALALLLLVAGGCRSHSAQGDGAPKVPKADGLGTGGQASGEPQGAAWRPSLGAMKHTLDNGLRIVLEERRTAPVVAFQMWVQVGSADETPAEAGLAHVHEHMLFKGTERRGVGEIAREVETCGGEINAWTSFDQTVYHLVLSSRFWEQGLDVLADAVRHPSFDADELGREREVILEELRSARDLPSREVSRRLFDRAFDRHPYRRPVIGFQETITGFTRADVLAFYEKWYVPRNMVLSVVGDIDTQEVLDAVRRQFGDWAPKGEPPIEMTRTPEEPQVGFRAAVAADSIHEVHLSLGFHVPAVTHDDVPPLDVLALLLGQGESARLLREVLRERQLVNDIHAYSYTPRDPGLLLVGATTSVDRVEPALRAILEQLFRLRHEPPEAADLRMARTMVEADTIFQRETAEGGARKLGYWESVVGDPHGEGAYLDAVGRVGPADVLRVAKTYLTPANLTVSVLLPKEASDAVDEASLATLVAEVDETVAARHAGEPAPPEGGEVSATTLANGLRLLVREDHTVPIVSIRVVYPGGLRHETDRTAGLHHFMATMMTRGTASRSAAEISRTVDTMAAGLSGFSGRNSFGLWGEFLSRDLRAGLELLTDCLLRPTFPEAEVEKQRSLVLEDIRAREDNPSGLAFQTFGRALFGDHPYHLEVLGTDESVSRITADELRRHHRRWFPAGAATLAVVGDVEAATVIREIDRLLGTDDRRPAERPAVAPWKPPAKRKVVFRRRDRSQAHLVLGFQGTTITDPDRVALEVLATVLGGQGGRLFSELREKRGLAYSVGALDLDGMDPGYFAVYAALSPDKIDEGVAGILEVLAGAVEAPVSGEELERARRYLVGAHDIALQRIGALASTMAFDEAQGLGYDYWRVYPERVMAVTAEDVLRAAKKHITLDRTVISVVLPGGATPALEADETER